MGGTGGIGRNPQAKLVMQKLFIIKIGGNVLDDEKMLQSFLSDFASIQYPKILVHGGGKIATKIGEQLGIESKYTNGRRITDEATRDLVSMVYGGLVNKQIIATLQNQNCNAIGLTGADGNVIAAIKRPKGTIDYGYVGDTESKNVNTSFLHFLLKQNTVPVFAPLTHEKGSMLNTNADTIASVLAIALSKHFTIRLIYCFEKKGVLKSVNDENSVISMLNAKSYQQLLENGTLANGILPKLENAFTAIQKGVNEVLIGSAQDLIKNMGDKTEGTLIRM